ncbi:PHO85 cyclin-5 [Coemansia sp. RSA 2167]|nr:PHO85 cyclin-5 [Coemansia sp. RSA 2167]KAJ2153875.1 PHO85 cyclin-5 [Coemansia sp. RSA 637]KAJ2536304.1 PHO85 cyclin-5 [Coemansia sp. RSA 1935]
MDSLPGHFSIESNARLHRQEAALTAGTGAMPGPAQTNDLAHVGGWNNANTAYQMHLNSAHVFAGKSLYGKVNEQLSMERVGAKRAHGRSDDAQSKRVREHGLRIDDLLNPATVSANAVRTESAGTALAAAHRMTVPSSLTRTRSDDSKHYYQQLVQLQHQLQLKQQQQLDTVDPTLRFTRTATAPTERPASDSSAHGLVREALELDKLYDIACVIIESIWPNHSLSQRTQLCSLRCFVSETHRQSRLSVDALELSMFYLLRAKSIIQAKQRAERQMEEAQEQKQQYTATDHRAGVDASTPPLSPETQVSAGTNTLVSAPMVVPVSVGGGTAVPSDTFTSPLDGNSPITPDSVHHGQVTYVGVDKQQLLTSGMITPLSPEKSKRALAGSTHSLPNSFRSFVAAKPAVPAASKPEPKEANAPGQSKPNVTKCGRRMFVAALISASKFMFDQSYSNKAWNKITKLPPRQISDMERAFLDMIDYRLYVDRSTYEKFHRLLARSGMRNGRLMVCDPLNAPLSPVSASTATTAVSSPVGRSASGPVDLRSAMNVPISISSTPIIHHPATTAGV